MFCGSTEKLFSGLLFLRVVSDEIVVVLHACILCAWREEVFFLSLYGDVGMRSVTQHFCGGALLDSWTMVLNVDIIGKSDLCLIWCLSKVVYMILLFDLICICH